MTGCLFHTTCIESAALGDCDENCYANTLNLKWLVIRAAFLIHRLIHCSFSTNAVYPYCMSYTYTDKGYSILDCDKYPDVVTYMGETYAGEIAYSTALPTITAEQSTSTDSVSFPSTAVAVASISYAASSFSTAGTTAGTEILQSTASDQQFTTSSSSASSEVNTSNDFSSTSGTEQNSSSHLSTIIGSIVSGVVAIAI